MSSERPMDFYEYTGAQLSMRVPVYLHDKKGIGFFEARSNKDKQRPLFAFGMEIVNDDRAEVHRELMTRVVPGSTGEQQGLRGTNIRRGKASYMTDGLEALGTNYVIASGKLHCYYNILFLLDSQHVYATFLGQDDLRTFEDLCKQIVSTVRLVEPGMTQLTMTKWRKTLSGLGNTDTKRLKQALDGLPSEIAYLRKSILAIAKQDQDLLGSGEADFGPIERSLRKVAKGNAIRKIAIGHADTLHQWLITLSDSTGAWAAPIGFVEGYLRGCAQFGEDNI